MYHPTRGGARGGAAEFSWDKVKQSKHREFYLGNSVAAPTGRWQDGRDINWYNKDVASSSTSVADERREELRRIKEAETAELYAKLGRAPPSATAGATAVVGERLARGSDGLGRKAGTGANTEVLDKDRKKWGTTGREEAVSEADEKLARKFAKDEVRRRRAAEVKDDRHGEDRGKAQSDDRCRHSSRSHHEDEARDGHRRHRHRDGSSRHRDGNREGSSSKQHLHADGGHDERSSRRHRSHQNDRSSRSRSRSRSPESLSRHRSRHHDERRHKRRGSPSGAGRGHRGEDEKHHHAPHSRRYHDGEGRPHRMHRDE